MAVVMITGTSTGIGLVTSITLGRANHKVYASMRDSGKSQLGKIVHKESLPVEIIKLDVNNEETIQKSVETIIEKEGKIDVLVNNAGIGGSGVIEETKLEDFKDTMETNYFGVIRCTKAVLPAMRKQGSGLIINISSVAGRTPFPAHGPYSASKFALEAFSEILAGEVRRYNIRVTIIEPGVIATPIFGKSKRASVASEYPHYKRLKALLSASLEKATSPDLVARKIYEIMESKTWKLRHTIGRYADTLIDWRDEMTDEEWVELGALDDESWIRKVEKNFDLDVRKYMDDPDN